MGIQALLLKVSLGFFRSIFVLVFFNVVNFSKVLEEHISSLTLES